MSYRLIIAGGRDFNDLAVFSYGIGQFLQEFELKRDKLEIVSGMARGADTLGVDYARKFGLKLHKFPADWNKYGKRAGYVRNQEMAYFADGLLAFWDRQSRGTAHMIKTMLEMHNPKDVLEVYY